MTCPVLIGTPPGALDHLTKIGGFIYGKNFSGSLAPVRKWTYPGMIAVGAPLFTSATGGGGAASVQGFAIRPDETALVVERIPSGTTSNGNAGPATAYYRIDPDRTITTIATGGIGIAGRAVYSTATDEFYTRQMTGTNDWYRVNMATGAMTSVVTGLGSEALPTADGVIWVNFSTTQIQRWVPESASFMSVTVQAHSSIPIAVGSELWIPSSSGTGKSVSPSGVVSDEPCMSGFPSMFSSAQDLLDSTISVCIDSSPLDIYEIASGSGPSWSVMWG